MVFLPVSHLTAESGLHVRPSRLSAAFGWVGDFFGMFGAAIRIARATEARRAPDRADLQKLGITGELPKTW